MELNRGRDQGQMIVLETTGSDYITIRKHLLDNVHRDGCGGFRYGKTVFQNIHEDRIVGHFETKIHHFEFHCPRIHRYRCRHGCQTFVLFPTYTTTSTTSCPFRRIVVGGVGVGIQIEIGVVGGGCRCGRNSF